MESLNMDLLFHKISDSIPLFELLETRIQCRPSSEQTNKIKFISDIYPC